MNLQQYKNELDRLWSKAFHSSDRSTTASQQFIQYTKENLDTLKGEVYYNFEDPNQHHTDESQINFVKWMGYLGVLTYFGEVTDKSSECNIYLYEDGTFGLRPNFDRLRPISLDMACILPQLREDDILGQLELLLGKGFSLEDFTSKVNNKNEYLIHDETNLGFLKNKIAEYI